MDLANVHSEAPVSVQPPRGVKASTRPGDLPTIPILRHLKIRLSIRRGNVGTFFCFRHKQTPTSKPLFTSTMDAFQSTRRQRLGRLFKVLDTRGLPFPTKQPTRLNTPELRPASSKIRLIVSLPERRVEFRAPLDTKMITILLKLEKFLGYDIK
jgi:hypothetical protein